MTKFRSKPKKRLIQKMARILGHIYDAHAHDHIEHEVEFLLDRGECKALYESFDIIDAAVNKIIRSKQRIGKP